MLHETHIGIVRMKSVARTYVWWPGIDCDIENWVKCCKACQSMSNKKSEQELSSWPKTNKPFQRIHMVFCMFDGNTFLIVEDTYSKWLEVYVMNNTNASATIEKLRNLFSIFGLPNEIVSDNGPPFNSKEFNAFCDANGIKLTHSPPYHPQSNGEAKVSVRKVKQSLKKMIIDEKERKTPISLKLSNFLLKYRTTPTTVTGESPANLIFGFKPRSLLDLLKPMPGGRANDFSNSTGVDVQVEQKSNLNGKTKEVPLYEIGEIVSYQIVWSNFVKWVPAKIIKRISPSVYVVLVNQTTKSAHLRQLRKSLAKEYTYVARSFYRKQFD